jgi:glycolate dehydrogenase FAD-binding subunit
MSVQEQSGWKQLEGMLGAEHVASDTAFLQEAGWERTLPKAFVTPASAEQLCEVMCLARAERWKVAPAGNLTKQRMGGIPEGIDLVISLRCMNRVTDYQPADLTVTVEAGTNIEMLAGVLREKGQMLPLDVPFTRAGATVGGAMATNSSGSRRLGYGSVRDMAIGVHFVTSDGTAAKGGGKVVKNVAGYDLMKLLIGSYGTLGIITEATLKVFPVPPASVTLVLGFTSAVHALEARNRILNSPFPPQALDLMDSAAGALTGVDALSESRFSLVFRAAGPEPMVERVRRELPLLIRQDGGKTAACLTGEPEEQLWHAIQETTPAILSRSRDAAVIKISVPLSKMLCIVAGAKRAAAESGLAVATLARAGTGIVYCHLWPPSDVGGSSMERMATVCESLLAEAARAGGYAVVEWCPSEMKRRITRWAPLGDDFPMMQRLKAQMDPEGLLNSGRLFGKI